jgi:hypothetical protein
MIPLTPQLLIATATAFVGVGGNPRDHLEGGSIYQLCLPSRIDGIPPNVGWDVALIHHWGFWSHFDHRMEVSSWPVSAVRTATDLAAFGSARGLIHEQPEVGDIFLQYAPKHGCFVHAGIVAVVCVRGLLTPNRSYVEVVTIEADCDEGGQVGGGKTVRLTRRLFPSDGDRFLRWADLDKYNPSVKRQRGSRIEIVPRKDWL